MKRGKKPGNAKRAHELISILFTLIFLTLLDQAKAQDKFTFNGSVTAEKTGEKLIGASLFVTDQHVGTSSNEYGYFSLTLPKGKHTVRVSAIGFTEQTIAIDLDKNINQDIALAAVEKSLENVVVVSSSKNRSLFSAQMGVEKISMQDVKHLPVLLGEKDILKTMQLLPGVKSAGDGNSGFYVRGGAADQNLILLDAAPVYNPSHLLGFFSTFNADAIKDVSLYKGSAPASYGGRLSSVVDIKMADGNNKNFSASGGLGLISSRLKLEGPLQQETSSFLITARRTYADLFLKLSNDSSINRNKLYFYDLNVKLNYKLSAKDQLFIAGYFGRDAMTLQNRYGMNWGNGTGTVRWNHIYTPKLFSNTTLIFSNYNYELFSRTENNDYTIFSQIRDWNLKQDFQWYINPKNTIQFGVHSNYHIIRPGEVTASEKSGIGNKELQKKYTWENAAFVSHNWKPADKINITYGVRLSAFHVLGGSDFYQLNNEGDVTDTISYAKNAFVKTYLNPEPRIGISYKINGLTSVKLSYTRNVQHLHLLTNSTSSAPTDKWVANTNNIKPELADQFAIGFYKDIKDRSYELSIETYYKDMQNQIDYKNGANIYTNNAIESQLLFGKGRAYGLEAQLKKKQGKLTGWISYTLSKTERKIDGINNNQWYNARQDRTHDIAIVATYQLTDKWTLSGSWVYYTGDAVTFPAGKYTVDGSTVFYYTERNAHRMPDYHRLDLGATVQLKKKGRFSSELSIGLYNAYGRENAYSIEFRDSKDHPGITEAVQTTLFKYIPSVTYNFKF
jgi:hypothetical protein